MRTSNTMTKVWSMTTLILTMKITLTRRTNYVLHVD
jgi:hypothetical protein